MYIDSPRPFDGGELCHLYTVSGTTPSFSAITAALKPSALDNTICARSARLRRVVERRSQPSSSERSRNLRSGTQWLLARAALRTRRPSLARAPLAVLLAAHKAAEERVFCALQLATLEAGARVLESRPIVALEVLAGVGRRACAEGLLLTALTAALTAARAQLALHRRDRAREALASGVLSDFADVPHTAAIQTTLAEVSERCKAGDLDPAFLDRLEVWPILVEHSPGVSLPPQA